MGTVHFSIGEDLGIRLAEIARDHIYDLDVEKALSVWKDAFGCPDNLTNRLTTGQLVVTVDDPVKCIINVSEREELSEDRKKEYPEITRDELVRLIEKNFRDYVDENNNENWDHLVLEISNVTRMVSDNEKLDITGQLYNKFLANLPGVTADVDLTVPARYVAKAVLDSKPNEFESELESLVYDLSEGYSGNQTGVHKFCKIVNVLRHCLNVLENKDKIARMLDFLDENFPDDKNAKFSNSESDLYWQLTNKHIRYNFENQWMPTIVDFISGVMTCATEPEKVSIPVTDELTKQFGSKNAKGDLLTQYIESQMEIDKALDNFGPVDIEDNYDAGWIAPDGKCFAMNGTAGNMIHLQLAEKIMEYYDLTKPEEIADYSIDYYLASYKGFVKFHHDWVTYEGYDCIRTNEPVPMTKKQIEAIVKYGNACYGGSLLFGYKRKKLEVDLFKNCSDYTFGQLFAI